MSNDFTKSFEVSADGIGITSDEGATKIWIGGGDLDPTQTPIPAPIGSRYFSSNGKQYEKFDANNADWREAAGVGSPTASPGFLFGKGGNNGGALEQVGGVPSDIVGIPNRLTNSRAVQAVVDNQNQTDYTLEFFEHTGSLANFNSILQVTVSSPVYGGVVNVDIPLTTGKNIGSRLISGSQKNGVAVLLVKGDALAL